MTEEQEIELKRLQSIVTEKRIAFLTLDKEVRETTGFNDVDLLAKYKKAETELQEASYNFNDFTGNLTLKKSS